ncbi:hypothetical protein GALMADRAFT_215175 [Galerina marginata CBS 339.88]|uniref:Uncharacterized protein n=1 Tax=Galerina marginata (strain CBS 339.88) TaxID=685588 RepID=A0A067SPC3_GALM3|nr:hypothetical protein GALMADRAFT_215175 [Galerina marginata CBS 339.88]
MKLYHIGIIVVSMNMARYMSNWYQRVSNDSGGVVRGGANDDWPRPAAAGKFSCLRLVHVPTLLDNVILGYFDKMEQRALTIGPRNERERGEVRICQYQNVVGITMLSKSTVTSDLKKRPNLPVQKKSERREIVRAYNDNSKSIAITCPSPLLTTTADIIYMLQIADGSGAATCSAPARAGVRLLITQLRVEGIKESTTTLRLTCGPNALGHRHRRDPSDRVRRGERNYPGLWVGNNAAAAAR